MVMKFATRTQDFKSKGRPKQTPDLTVDRLPVQKNVHQLISNHKYQKNETHPHRNPTSPIRLFGNELVHSTLIVRRKGR
ncbi:hypothetical protein PoB_004774300 [Plakobranchus ocellatus]|uniref:Uncharacterized protein n=1 Tax=Plakobranchus ocellatus TaxID=259542 RepID=A0AAV4BR02_9GAST|nr:hypothetical protein PoB_004774300 [Plakobranchus ocellatus]